MTLHCEKCGMQVGNVKKATCAKHGPMVPMAIVSAGRWVPKK